MWIQPSSAPVTQEPFGTNNQTVEEQRNTRNMAWTWLDTFCGKFHNRQDSKKKHRQRYAQVNSPQTLKTFCFGQPASRWILTTPKQSCSTPSEALCTQAIGVQHWLFWPSRTWRRDQLRRARRVRWPGGVELVVQEQHLTVAKDTSVGNGTGRI